MVLMRQLASMRRCLPGTEAVALLCIAEMQAHEQLLKLQRCLVMDDSMYASQGCMCEL